MISKPRLIFKRVFMLAALIGLSGFQGRAAEVNRVRNGGFEATADVSGGWLAHGGLARIVTGQEGKEAYRGKQCLCIQTTDKAGGLYYPNVGVAGIEYGYRFAVRGKGRFYLRLLEYGEKGSGCVASPLIVEKDASPEWKEYTGVFQASNPATREFSIAIGGGPRSEIYFDEISVWESKYIGGKSRFDYGMGDQSYDRLVAQPLVSRHVPWANPLAGGKLKTLVICPQYLVRGVIELAERLEMDYTVIPTGRSDSFYYPGAFAAIMPVPGYSLIVEQLARERLAPERHYDLIIVADFSWAALPEFVRQNLLDRVKNGAGLLYRECSPSPGNDSSTVGMVGASTGKAFPLDVLPDATPQTEVVNRFYRHFPMTMLPLVPVTDTADAIRKCKENGGTEETECGWRGGFWQKTPKALMPVTVKCGALGKGRVAFLDYYQGWNFLSYGRGGEAWLTPHNLVTNPVHYEYFHSWLVKLCLWTAAREGKDAGALQVEMPKTLERDAMPGNPLPLKLQTAVPDAQRCEYAIRDSQCDPVHSAAADIQGTGAARQVMIAMPFLPQGDYTLDVWLLNAAKAKAAFASAQFVVTATNGIETLTTERDRYKDGDTVTGTFALRMLLRPGERVEVSLQDSWNRILAKTALTSVDGKAGAFSLPLRLPLPGSVRVAGELVDARGRVDLKSTLVGIPSTENRDFYLITPAHGYALEAVDRFVAEQVIARFPAFNAGKPWGGLLSTARQVAQWNLPSLVFVNSGMGYSGGHSAWKDGLKDGPHGPVFKDCPTLKANNLEGVCKLIGSANAPFGVIGHTVNSETYLIPEFCFCENCLGRFRTWLKGVYHDDIRALNREWAANYTDFNQAMPARLDELKECEAKGGAARWLDSRLFMYDQAWTQAFRNEAVWLKPYYDKVSTSVLNCKFVQVENFTPFIWENLFKDVKGYEMEVQDYSPAESLMYEMAADYGEDQHYSGPWIDPCWNWETEHHKMRLAPWWLLFHGARGIVMWGLGPNPDVAGGCRPLTADFSDALDYFKILHGQIAELQTGIATLITSSRKVRSPIAIVLSSRNSFAARLMPQADCSFQDAFESHFIALQTMGLQPQFVGQDDLTPELIKAKNLKALVLPYNRAMSAGTAQVLLDFVKDGGLLLADNQPGLFTEHGRKLETSSLAALYPRFKPELYQTVYGKGTAVYLGGQLNGGQQKILDGNFSRLYALLELFKTRQGIEPAVRIVDAAGVDRFEVFRTIFQYGSGQYLCVLKDPVIKGASTNAQSSIVLQEKHHVYDVRGKQYLGFIDTIRTEIKPYEARVFALLPAKPQGVTMQTGQKHVKQGEHLPITINIGYVVRERISAVVRSFFCRQEPDFGNCVFIQVNRPGGELVKYYTRKAAFKGSALHLDLPVSLNEVPGAYEITAENVVTGERAKATFMVKE